MWLPPGARVPAPPMSPSRAAAAPASPHAMGGASWLGSSGLGPSAPKGPPSPAGGDLQAQATAGVEILVQRVEGMLRQPGSIFRSAVAAGDDDAALQAVVAVVRTAIPAALGKVLSRAPRQPLQSRPSAGGGIRVRQTGLGPPGLGLGDADPDPDVLQNLTEGLDVRFLDDLLGPMNGDPVDNDTKSAPLPRRGAAAAAGASARASSKDLVEALRKGLLDLEHRVPWQGVRKEWRQRRNNWRRGVKAAVGAGDLAGRLRDLYEALVLPQLGVTPDPVDLKRWETSLRKGASRGCSAERLWGLWEELLDWLGEDGAGLPSTELEGLAKDAIQRMEDAVTKGEEYLSNVSLRQLLGNSRDAFRLVQDMLEKEKAEIHTKLASLNGTTKLVADLRVESGTTSGQDLLANIMNTDDGQDTDMSDSD